MVRATSQEFQRSPRHFFNARNFPTRLAWMLTSLLGSLLNTEEDIKGKKDLQLIQNFMYNLTQTLESSIARCILKEAAIRRIINDNVKQRTMSNK